MSARACLTCPGRVSVPLMVFNTDRAHAAGYCAAADLLFLQNRHLNAAFQSLSTNSMW